jgi:hypothetical protein
VGDARAAARDELVEPVGDLRNRAVLVRGKCVEIVGARPGDDLAGGIVAEAQRQILVGAREVLSELRQARGEVVAVAGDGAVDG